MAALRAAMSVAREVLSSNQPRALAFATTFSTVKPNLSMSRGPGADAPKRSMETRVRTLMNQLHNGVVMWRCRTEYHIHSQICHVRMA